MLPAKLLSVYYAIVLVAVSNERFTTLEGRNKSSLNFWTIQLRTVDGRCGMKICPRGQLSGKL